MAMWTVLYLPYATRRRALSHLLLALGLNVAFQPLMAHQPHDPMNVVALSPNYSQDQTVFVATGALTTPLPVAEYVPLASTNAGFTYTVMPGLPNQPMSAISVSPGYAKDGTVFMAGQGGLWMSTNRGSSWASTGGTPLASGVQSVALTPNFTAKGVVYALTVSGVFGSADHGNTWQQLTTPSPLTSNLTVVAVSPNYAVDRTVVVGSVSNGIFVSKNYTSTWTQATAGLTLPQVTGIAFSPAYSSDHTIFATTMGNGVYVSTNGGTTWTQANSGITDLKATAIAISPNFAANSSLWVSTAAAGVFHSANRGSSWTLTGAVPRPLSNQTATHYTTLAAAASGSGTTLFVGMFEGLWTSTNGGATWTYCDTVPTRMVRQMKLSPTYKLDQTVFVSTYGGGTLWSTDGGLSTGGSQAWSFRNTGLPDSYTDANEMSPNFASDQMAFVGTTLGLERISGGSTTWTLMSAMGKPTFPRSLGISPNFVNDSTIFIGTHLGISYPLIAHYNNQCYSNQGLFISADAGQTWAPTGLEPACSCTGPCSGPPIDTIAVSPNYANDKTLFAGSSTSGLYKSTDGGATVTQLKVVSNDPAVLPVVVSPAYATDRTVFTGTSHSGIYKSTDGGQSWTVLPATAPPNQITAFSIALSPNYASDQTMFIGTMQQGLLKSMDGGNTFAPIPAVPGNYVSGVAISSNYASDQTVFAASYLGLYKSTDGGLTWAYTAEPARQEEWRQFNPGGFTTINYQGSWPIVRDSSASTSQLASTTASGATASFTFLGSGLEWIGKMSPTGGTAQVSLDGGPPTTVDLHATTTLEQQTLWVQHPLPCTVHTVTIDATPAAGQSVNLDALDVWQDTCSWAAAQPAADVK